MARAITAAAATKQRDVETNAVRPVALRLEGREILELFETAIDLLASQRTESLDAEALAAEAAHHGAVNHGAPQFIRIHAFVLHVDSRARQVAHETAGQ